MFSMFKRASLLMLSIMAALMFAFSLPAQAEQEEADVAQREMSQLAGADFWRQVRQGEEGYTTSQFLSLIHI